MIDHLISWMLGKGLSRGVRDYPLLGENGEPLAMFDLAWPNGLQERLSQPLALLVDEPVATRDAANHAGYRYFTDAVLFKWYVKDEYLSESFRF